MGSVVPPSAGAVATATATAEAVLARLPARLRRRVVWLLSRYPGRIVLGTAASCIRIEIFDRSMTIAAQFFTSVFPILILVATWASGRDTEAIAQAVGVPKAARSVLDEAAQASDSTTFGIAGTLIVLVSATSLSRALTRAFAAIWALPRPHSKLSSAWRWLVVVLALSFAMVVVRISTSIAAQVPPGNVWQLAVSLTCDLAIAVVVPLTLLIGAVQPRHLLPGALAFGLVMLVVRPASAAWLPRALETSSERYGSIGVAFTYLGWLYVVSFCFLATAAIGQVIATDSGWFGKWLRGQPLMHTPATAAR